jgi:glycosyltransferase involved in cell wall biosynthesis
MKEANEFIVTIAIPFYNAEKYLDLAIQSVFDQTFQNWKLVLINDGSTDRSLEIALKFQNDKRVLVISDGKNKNLVYRLNQISNLADTKYLARMDADDIMHPEKIAKQIAVLETNPEIDVLGTNSFTIDENSLVQGIRLNYNKEIPLLKVNGFIHPTIIAKTDWFINNPYDFKAERIEDTELWIRTSSKYNFQILTEPLLFYREISENYYKKYLKGFISTLYMINKHKYKMVCIKFGLKYFITAFIYYLFSFFNKENYLVHKRNAVIISGVKMEELIN